MKQEKGRKLNLSDYINITFELSDFFFVGPRNLLCSHKRLQNIDYLVRGIGALVVAIACCVAVCVYV